MSFAVSVALSIIFFFLNADFKAVENKRARGGQSPPGFSAAERQSRLWIFS